MSVEGEDPLQRVIQVEADLAKAMNSENPGIRAAALAEHLRSLILEDRLELNDLRALDMVTEEEFIYLKALQGEF